MKAQFFHYKILEVKPISALHEFQDHPRLRVFFRKGCKCVECGKEATKIALGLAPNNGGKHWDVYTDTFYPLTVDHIWPKSKGGSNALDNLQPMCHGCNQRKGNGDGVNKNGVSGGGLYSCLGHTCKWPRTPKRTREELREVIEPQLGWLVYKRKGAYGYEELGTISLIGINPHTDRPAVQIEDKPGSWYHYSQLKRLKI